MYTIVLFLLFSLISYVSLIFMNIQISLIVYLVILVKMQCLDLNLVPSFIFYDS